jgi:hypothetical protein
MEVMEMNRQRASDGTCKHAVVDAHIFHVTLNTIQFAD